MARTTSSAAGFRMLICLVALAPWLGSCHDDDGHVGLAGLHSGDFTGSWREVLTGTGNSCAFPGVENGEHIVTIAQDGTDALIDCVDLCGRKFCHLAGTVSGRTIRSTLSNSSPSQYLFCYDNYDFTLAGTLEGDSVNGSVVERYFRAGVLCPPELHTSCSITYAFAWTHCPPADCAIQVCQESSQAVPSLDRPFWGHQPE